MGLAYTYRRLLFGLYIFKISKSFVVMHLKAKITKSHQGVLGTLLLHSDYQPDNDLKLVSKGLNINSTYPFLQMVLL